MSYFDFPTPTSDRTIDEALEARNEFMISHDCEPEKVFIPIARQWYINCEQHLSKDDNFTHLAGMNIIWHPQFEVKVA